MALSEEEKARIIEEEELRNSIRDNNPKIFDFSADGLWNSFVGSVKLALVLLLIFSAGGILASYLNHAFEDKLVFVKKIPPEDYNLSDERDVEEYLFSYRKVED